MKAGELRHRVVIERKDASGNWGSPITVSAKLEPLGRMPRPGTAAAAPVSQRAFTITTRWMRGITHMSNRIRFGTRYFDIRSVLNHEERSREMIMHCEEIIPVIDEYGEPADI